MSDRITKIRERVSRGFTVVELVVVIVILSILATIIVIAYREVINNSYDSATKTELSSLASQVKGFVAKNPADPQYVWQVRVRVNPEAYNLDNHNNGAICIKGNQFTVAILGKSGKAFYRDPTTGQINEFTPDWSDDLTTTCDWILGAGTYSQGSWEWQSNHWEPDWVTVSSS